MQQMWRYGITLIFLIVSAVQDWKNRRLSLVSILIFGMAGIILNLRFSFDPLSFLIGILPGVLLLLLSWLTRRQIGAGDGAAMLVIGVLLANKETIAIVLMGFYFCACSGIVLLLLKRAGRKKRLPFLPYLLLGFCIKLWMEL